MIKLGNISKSVVSGAERLTILKPLYLTIPDGQFVAIVGPSGSGKSTLLSLLAGLDKPTTGYIGLHGEYLTQMGEDELSRLRGSKVGFVFQSFHLIPSLTAYENILVPMEIAGLPRAGERARALLDEVGLGERGHHYPSQLSGGEQQRVAIARAFANNPSILLADEPTGNLDARNGAHIFDLLVALNRERKTTLLLVTHDRALAARADRIISLRDGQVVGDEVRGGKEEGVRGGVPAATGLPPSPAGGWRRSTFRFIGNMAWRETRASWYRLLLFFFCIAVGVGSIVGLRSLVQNMKTAVEREARSFYAAADVRAGTNKPWTPEARAALAGLAASPLVTAHTEMIVTETMALAGDNADAPPVLVQLRGVQPEFPLYGEVRLTGGGRYTHALLEGRGAVISEGVRAPLNLAVGDPLEIGQLRFTVRGVLERMPGNGLDFSPLPRVLVDYREVEATGLLGFGSRASRLWLFKTPEGEDEALSKELARALRSTPDVRWGSFRGQENIMTRLLENWERFLGTVGLAILVLGGIGISSVTRVFVQQKLKTIAILKILGGDNRLVLGAYLAQILALSLIGSLLGLLFASLLTTAASRYAAGRLPLEVVSGLTWPAALQGLGVGVLVVLLFALPPLLEIRQVKPILVLRSWAAARRRLDWLRLGAGLLILPGLFSLAAWQSGSLKNAAIFLGWVVATTAALNLAGLALMRALRRLRRLPSFALRQGVSSLYRPGNQTQVILFAVGLGALSIIAIRLNQVNVQGEYKVDLDAAAGDIFLIDIQKDQRQAAEAIVERLGGTEAQFIPVVPARLVGLTRGPNNPEQLSPDELRERFGWAQRFSYRPTLGTSEEVIAGQFWEPTPGTEPEVSVEEGYAHDLLLAVGDRLAFDVIGKRIEARVTSIRHAGRRISPVSSIGRFNVIFRPGTLEDAPQTFLGAVKGPPPGPLRTQVQREIVARFPNVTLIDAFETVAELRKRLGDLSFAVSFLGGFVFLCGVLILAGSVAMTKYQRLYEAAILKTLGAEKKLLVFITLIEYGVLGLLSGLIGSAAATGLTWALSAYSLKIPWRFAPAVNLTGVAVTLLLVTAVGVLASWDVIREKPLGLLRAE